MLSPAPEKYTKLLCVFSKWCKLLGHQYLNGSPNTATLFWFRDTAPADDEKHMEHFSIYTNLAPPKTPPSKSTPSKAPPSKSAPSQSSPKEQARRIRKRHLKNHLGHLGPEPKATSTIKVQKNTKFGHCAETLALTRYVLQFHKGMSFKLSMTC